MAPSRTLLFALAFVACSGMAAAAGSLEAEMGKRLFRRAWVPAPASTHADDGLGPLYNARSCLACHTGMARADSRAPDPLASGFVIRLGDRTGAGDPRLGHQLQTQATVAVPLEGHATLAWQAEAGLRRPALTVTPTDGRMAPATRASLRAAPALALAGRIEAVPAEAILAAESAGKTGIGGRAARLAAGGIGRFGWKATAPDLTAFTARAFALDLGLSTDAYPDAAGDCTDLQTACRAAPGVQPADRPEIAPDILALIVDFLREIPAPAARPAPPRSFTTTGCAACHQPRLGGETLYSDLLLHDMGAGLDDGVAEGDARPGEWRTAPLAGLGAAQKAGLLHDGRARSIVEAIRWHGGAAAPARDRFSALPARERARLLRFLGDL